MKVKIQKISDEALNIKSYTLVAADGGTLPSYSAGSHVDVMISDDLSRQYSICSDPAQNAHYRLGIQKDPNSTGGSVAIFDGFKEGQEIEISEPRNHFEMDEAGSSFVLIGGGIGITPILAMAQRLRDLGKSYKLYYLARSEEHFGFADILSDEALSKNLTRHNDAKDGLPDLNTITGEYSDGRHVYCCGPAPLMDAVKTACENWPTSHVHFEHFTRDEVDTSGDQPFEIQLGRDGPVLTVGANESAMDVLVANGIEVEKQCTQGLCGTCEQAVLEGDIDHRDMVLEDDEKAENSCMMVCVSRAKSKRIILDV